MATHPRLGSQSPAAILTDDTLRVIRQNMRGDWPLNVGGVMLRHLDALLEAHLQYGVLQGSATLMLDELRSKSERLTRFFSPITDLYDQRPTLTIENVLKGPTVQLHK